MGKLCVMARAMSRTSRRNRGRFVGFGRGNANMALGLPSLSRGDMCRFAFSKGKRSQRVALKQPASRHPWSWLKTKWASWGDHPYIRWQFHRPRHGHVFGQGCAPESDKCALNQVAPASLVLWAKTVCQRAWCAYFLGPMLDPLEPLSNIGIVSDSGHPARRSMEEMRNSSQVGSLR